MNDTVTMNKVFQSIVSERAYQSAEEKDEKSHIVESFPLSAGITAIEHNLRKAADSWYNGKAPYQESMNLIRKIGAICIKMGEQYGMQPREGHEDSFTFVKGDIIICQHDNTFRYCVCADYGDAVFGKLNLNNDGYHISYEDLFVVSNIKTDGTGFKYKRITENDLRLRIFSSSQNSSDKGEKELEEASHSS